MRKSAPVTILFSKIFVSHHQLRGSTIEKDVRNCQENPEKYNVLIKDRLLLKDN